MQVKYLLNFAGDRLYGLPLVILYLTDGCNSRCRMCDIWQNPRRNMPLALADEIAAACGELGVRWVLLSGGEAMQHPQWSTIAQRFREEGVHVMLLTNGLLLRKQIEQVAASVDEVIVSLDAGTAATYDVIRGVDAFDLVLDGIDAVRAHQIPVTTRTTVQQANFREIPGIVELGLAHDVNSISFLAIDVANTVAFGKRMLTPATTLPDGALSREDISALSDILDDLKVHYAGAFASGKIAESPEKLERILVRYFQALHDDVPFEPPRCNAPHFSTVIEVDGRLRPCYFLPAYGRLQPGGDRLPQAINWQAARDLRRAYRTGTRVECQRCVCPLYTSPRSALTL